VLANSEVVGLAPRSGLPDFFWYDIPKLHNCTKIATKYTKWPQNRPYGHKLYQHLSLQDTPKFTPIGIFGLKTYHPATLS
jgi:hypothetical protein